jgi:hypothetical protein
MRSPGSRSSAGICAPERPRPPVLQPSLRSPISPLPPGPAAPVRGGPSHDAGIRR